MCTKYVQNTSKYAKKNEHIFPPAELLLFIDQFVIWTLTTYKKKLAEFDNNNNFHTPPV